MRYRVLLSALLACSGIAIGQTVGTADLPQCFYHEQSPGEWDDDNFDPRVVPMIRVHVDAGNGDYVAGLVRTQINNRVAQFPAHETFIREHV